MKKPSAAENQMDTAMIIGKHKPPTSYLLRRTSGAISFAMVTNLADHRHNVHSA